MVRYCSILLLVFFQVSSFAQTDSTSFTDSTYKPEVKEHKFKLGDSSVYVFTSDYEPELSVAFISLHSNETTGIRAADTFLQTTCGYLVRLENNEQRNVKFTYNKKVYEFDPNRIFSKEGIIASLKLHKSYDAAVVPQIQRFASSLINKWKNATTYIAVHNNTDSSYSILSYLKGGSSFKDAKAVHRNIEMDIDDFFFTTDINIYRKLKERNFNVILQDNKLAKDDGSLSIYYGRRGKRYVNVEAEHGHYEVQLEMLNVLWQVIDEIVNGEALGNSNSFGR